MLKWIKNLAEGQKTIWVSHQDKIKQKTLLKKITAKTDFLFNCALTNLNFDHHYHLN